MDAVMFWMAASLDSRDGQLPIVPSSIVTSFMLPDRAGCNTISNKLSRMLGISGDMFSSKFG